MKVRLRLDKSFYGHPVYRGNNIDNRYALVRGEEASRGLLHGEEGAQRIFGFL
jgi:hypothetical protein